MSNKRIIKALEELVKTEHMAVAALDSATELAEDNKLRKQYRKWRDSHIKQADALNDRLEELGGAAVGYEIGSGKGQATLWGKLSGVRDDVGIASMRLGAERGIKRYIDHLEEIDDPKALSIIRKNLEAKQDEIEWYDEQVGKERSQALDTKLQVSKEKAMDLPMDVNSNGKAAKKGGFPFPLLVVLGAIGAAAYFLLRRGEESDYDDYGEDAFSYEGEGEGTGAESYRDNYGNGAGANDYVTGMSAGLDVSNPT